MRNTPWKIHDGVVYDSNECDVQPSHALAEGVRAVNAHDALVSALDSIVGSGSQMEEHCDAAEHDADSACIWCEARAALKLAEGK